MTDVTLEVVRLTKRYRARTALQAASFSARQGEVVGLLGPNGAGKTTTIRLLSTVLTPTSGEFWVSGRPHTAPMEIRRTVGVLPESGGYPAYETGEEYLSRQARLFGMNRNTARGEARSALTAVGLDERAGSRISTFSRGMRQRLGIARALINKPTVVFLDEPTLGLDPAGQIQVLKIVRDVAAAGTTVILSTHTLHEVEEVCYQVLILSRGKVLAVGSVGQVIATAAVEQSAQLRVPIDLVERAEQVLESVAIFAVEHLEGRGGVLKVEVKSSARIHPAERSTTLNKALDAIVSARIPVLSFELEGARLSDAFLQMTNAGAT